MSSSGTFALRRARTALGMQSTSFDVYGMRSEFSRIRSGPWCFTHSTTVARDDAKRAAEARGGLGPTTRGSRRCSSAPWPPGSSTG